MCDQCGAMMINGVACHEHGCPNRHLNPATGKPYKVECLWCGADCTPDTNGGQFCCEDCSESFNN